MTAKKGLLFLIAVEGFLLYLFPPTLVLNSSFIAGGDTPSHFPAALALRESLLSGESLFQWIHGNYAGFPLFLNYFPFPFFIMSLLSMFMPMMSAFKLVTLVPVFGLPAAIYAALSRLGCRGPVPGLGSALSLPFLLMKENAMWGGNMGSTLAGEFAFGISLIIAIYLSAKLFHDVRSGRSLFRNSFLESLVALGNGYPLLQVGFGTSYFLLRKRFFTYIIGLHCLAFALMGFWILPLIWRLPWDTPFNHAWHFESWKEPLPVAVLPALLGIVLGWSTRWWPGSGSTSPVHPGQERDTAYNRQIRRKERHSRSGRRKLLAAITSVRADNVAGLAPAHPDEDPRPYLWWNVGVALTCFSFANVAGLVDIRFLPFAHVFVILLGAIGWGQVLERLKYPSACAGIMVLAILAWGGATLEPMRSWIKWNYSGFEAKPLWQPFSQVNQYLRGTQNSARVVYEHSAAVNDAGTERAFELLPHFSGRSTLEGLYMQSSVSSPIHLLPSVRTHTDPLLSLSRLLLFQVRSGQGSPPPSTVQRQPGDFDDGRNRSGA